MGLRYLGDVIPFSWARNWKEPLWNYCANHVQYKVPFSFGGLSCSCLGSLHKISNINSLQTVLFILSRPHVYHLTYSSEISRLDIGIVIEKRKLKLWEVKCLLQVFIATK